MAKGKRAAAKNRRDARDRSADSLIIESYKAVMDGLAAYFGDAFEFVLHDLADLDHSIIRLINGFHSGRREGAPITDLALSMLEKIQEGGGEKSEPYISYISKNKYGKPVRSATIVIFGAGKRAIGLLCVNLYLDSPIQSLLRNFSVMPQPDYVTETFINDSDELISRSLEKVKGEVNGDGSVPPSRKNKEIITILYHQGIFRLKNAVQAISSDLGISRNTVYLHIRSLEEKYRFAEVSGKQLGPVPEPARLTKKKFSNKIK
ncbi:MAG: PAS domain-containing protein [Treponema sp.]|jgi:predicted transcriptional regulator YheO|nr:PAS domain-containing protein [Treponema sp.]